MALLPRFGIKGFSAQPRRSGGAYVTFQNAEAVQRILGDIEDGLKVQTNRDLRAESKKIAAEVVIPQLKRAARSSQAPLARPFAETARPKSDRIITVQVGGVNPPLSGFKSRKRATGKTSSGRDNTAKNYRTSMAWGSEYGPFPSANVNNYGVPRSASGYWVTPGVTNAIPETKRRYETFLEHLIVTRSRYR